MQASFDVLHFVDWNETTVHYYLIKKNVPKDVAAKFKEHGISGEQLTRKYKIWKTKHLEETLGLIIPLDVRMRVERIIDELNVAYEYFKAKEFQDSVHGTITLHPLLVKMVDTPQFQRLRDIKQLGGVYHVYPGASHNRFEHSIGVCYLADEFVKTLQEQLPDIEMSNRDILCVKIAALCHDLGHGPYSHLFEDLFVPNMCGEKGQKWSSKNGSVKLLEYMMKSNEELYIEFEKYGLQWSEDKQFISELITGVPLEKLKKSSCPPKKHFLYEIVSNSINGVDVDKMDYIARDGKCLGVNKSFEWRRYMKTCRVIEIDGSTHICPPEKEEQTLRDLFESRNYFHRIAYNHKTKLIIERMVYDALVLVNEYFYLLGEHSRKVKMSEAIDDMCAFTKLTDSVIYNIKFSPTNNVAFHRAREILAHIDQRKFHYKLELIHPSDDADGSETDEGLGTVDKWIQPIVFDYGFGEEHPVNKIWFYSKHTPTQAHILTMDQQETLICKKTIKYKFQRIRPFKRHDSQKTEEKPVTIEDSPYVVNDDLEEHSEEIQSHDDTEASTVDLSKPKLKPSPKPSPKSSPEYCSVNKEEHYSVLPQVFTTVIFLMAIIWSHYDSTSSKTSADFFQALAVQTKRFIVPGGQPTYIDISDYGFTMSVPETALPNGFMAVVTVSVIVSGPFRYPKGQKISSAFYWVSSTKQFLQPVMIHIKHNSVNISSSLANHQPKIRFIRASDDEMINGTFIMTKTLETGSFSDDSQYGRINVTSFSTFAICSDHDVDELFYGYLFKKKDDRFIWKYSFVIIRQMADGIFRELINESYKNWDMEPPTTVLFGPSEEIELKLTKKFSNEWEAMPLYDPPKYSKYELVQSLKIVSNMQFHVQRKTHNAADNSSTFTQKLILVGSKKPKSITVLLSLSKDSQDEKSSHIIQDERQLHKWCDQISKPLQYCTCLHIRTKQCERIIRDQKSTKEQLIAMNSHWFYDGERTWNEFADAFDCMNLPVIAKQIREHLQS